MEKKLTQKKSFFWLPEYLENSAWIEHIPFAFWIIEVLKPKVMVELGVHTGTSYFAFCQAVKKLDLNTVCYGVDTWIGDEHSGFYGEEVFRKVNGYNSNVYSRFSTLIKSTFDEAGNYFIDRSIDLLHIDGLHTYEAVKHDFETWLPKLSPTAIVIFHDINVKERDFGVFRLWEELKKVYPNFQFDFGFGLGLIAVGKMENEELKNLVDEKMGDTYIFLRNLLSDRGFFIKTKLDFSQALEYEKKRIETLQSENINFLEKYNASNTNNEELKEIYKVLESGHQLLILKYDAIVKDKEDRIESYRALNLAYNQLTMEHNSIIKSNQQLNENYKMLESIYSHLSQGYSIIVKNNEQLAERFKILEEDHNKVSLEYSVVTENIKQLTKECNLLKSSYKEVSDKNNELLITASQLTQTNEVLILENRKLAENNKALFLTNRKEFENAEALESQNIGLKEKLNVYAYEQQENLKKTDLISHSLSSEIAKLRDDYEFVRKGLEWYKATYEDRSLAGVIKEKLKAKVRHIYRSLINFILKRKRLKRKYALTYSLEYVRENGIRYSAKRTAVLVRTKGFKSISRAALQKKAVEKLKASQSLLVPVSLHVESEGTEISLQELKYKPRISIIMPVFNSRPALLELAIKSVKDQLYDNWELCIADDCSTSPETILSLKKYKKDYGIKIHFSKKNGGISEASNAAIKLATGDFIALLDHDDELTPDALYWIVKKINEQKNADIIYSDECKVDEQGNLSDYFFKPEWSPELLINMMYIGHLTVYRREFLLNKVGLFRKEYDYSQDYDLALRATEKTQNIFHVDKIIYHWRLTAGSGSQGDKPYARITNLSALKDAAKRRKIKGEIIELPTANRLKIQLNPDTKVSLIIPTDSYENLMETIESIRSNTAYANYEIVPVTNSPLIEKMKETISSENIFYVPYDKEYNFSDKCNTGVFSSSGEIVIFFNDDVRPLQDDWISNTIEFLEIPGVGGVSPKLIYENDSIQYAGMATGVRNLTGTTFHCYPKDSTHYINFPQLVRNVSILSGACMAMRKKLFQQLNGFDIENTPVAHSDVDLSFKIIDAGFRCVYTPYATLRHIGHLSLKKVKENNNKDKSDLFLLKRWSKYLHEDKYFTVPMKNLLYHDSPEPFRLYSENPLFNKQSKGDILLVCHDLTLSGAPIMLLNTGKVLQSLGYYVILVCSKDGPLKKMYLRAGIQVIVDELVLRQHPAFERFARNFDFIICNTVVTWPVVNQMQNSVKTLWWIQEGEVLNYFSGSLDFLNTLKNAKNLIGVSDYNISFVKPYNNKIAKIYNACPDILTGSNKNEKKKEKIIFSLIGSIEARKGHDILIDALMNISPSLLTNVEVWFIGRTLDIHFLNSFLEKINKLEFINLMGEKSHEECLELMKESDVILNISRDDPFPVVLVEALCLGKTCIISSHSGLSELIEEGAKGYVFEKGNTKELAVKIKAILNDPMSLEKIRGNARKTYEKYLTLETFQEKLNSYMQYQTV